MRLTRTVRVTLLVVAAVLAASPAASGDDDEDGEIVAFPRTSVAVSLAGHGTRVAGASETGFGASLELALGRERWQYFVETGFATSSRAAPTVAMPDARLGGRMVRGGLGARWLARQFRPDATGAIELFLVSLVGGQRYDLEADDRVTRPELALGVGVQGRSFRRPRFAFRLDARVLYTSDNSMGFMSGAGVAW